MTLVWTAFGTSQTGKGTGLRVCQDPQWPPLRGKDVSHGEEGAFKCSLSSLSLTSMGWRMCTWIER